MIKHTSLTRANALSRAHLHVALTFLQTSGETDWLSHAAQVYEKRETPVRGEADQAPERPALPPLAKIQKPEPIAPDVATGPDLDAVRAHLATLTTLAELDAAIHAYEGCAALKKLAQNTVISAGPDQARLMVIGEAPGAEEDRRGEPFVGAAGRLLDQMLASIGQNRQNTHITNTLYWRPPGNRTPTPQEIALTLPFVERRIQLIRPDVLLLLGGVAAKAVLNTGDGISKLRGHWQSHPTGEGPTATLATFHPAYLLRNPPHKALVWRDLLQVQQRLQTLS